MNIQEFSHRMTRDDHPSALIRALRELRGQNLDRIRRARRGGADWGVWTGGEPEDGAEQPDLS